ncbi:MAG: hypothetical protein KC416_02130 [Myxococcales bacterium]|nr:hypothetical protein [Myxococcales bacterium]
MMIGRSVPALAVLCLFACDGTADPGPLDASSDATGPSSADGNMGPGDASGDANAGTDGGASDPSGKLYFAPPDGWDSYPVYTVSNSNRTITVPAGKNARVEFSEVVTSGPVTLRGGHNIVVMGGEINLSNWDKNPVAPGQGATNRGLVLGNSSSYPTTGTIHIEGLYIHGRIADGGIIVATGDPDDGSADRLGTIVQVVNTRIGNPVTGFGWDDGPMIGTKAGNHADVIQSWMGPAGGLYVDKLSGWTTYQGIFLRPNDGNVGGNSKRRAPRAVVMSRGDIHAVKGSFPYGGSNYDVGGRYNYWRGTDPAHGGEGEYPWYNYDTWTDPGNTGHGARDTEWDSQADNPNDEPNTFFGAPDSGEDLHEGTPPTGPFVMPENIGMGYQSPGYTEPGWLETVHP